MNAFTPLETQTASNLTFAPVKFANTYNQLIDENEPALQLMHNLVLNPIQHIEIDTRLDEVELILNKTHHKMSFVIDAKDKIVGLISNARLGSRHILATADRLNCHRKELTIGDVMLPINTLQQTNLKQVEQSTVGSITKTMEQTCSEFLLVTDDTQTNFIGYFGLIDLAKVVGLNLYTVKRANKFSDIVDTLLHHTEI